ncbi:MAG: hypothetical protein K8I27_05825 [Planctomycetes bacterium]|nr:hypothetical protein [Planctomycetota bacterium]
MGKLLKAGVYVFAVIGVVMTAGVGYVYATNGELMGEFWAVKEDFRAVPPDRRKEVVAELPARITFEREVADEMAELPEERRNELYSQLTESRDKVYEQFKLRITQEAEFARKLKEAAKPVEDMAKEIEKELGKVNVGIDMTGKGSKPAVDNLSDVNKAKGAITTARVGYGQARLSGDTGKRVDAAVDVLKAIDKFGDAVQSARKKSLTGDEKAGLSDSVTDVKQTFYDIKQTPGLIEDARAKKYFTSIPEKLND